jgi:hypothetical protein
MGIEPAKQPFERSIAVGGEPHLLGELVGGVVIRKTHCAIRAADRCKNRDEFRGKIIKDLRLRRLIAGNRTQCDRPEIISNRAAEQLELAARKVRCTGDSGPKYRTRARPCHCSRR